MLCLVFMVDVNHENILAVNNCHITVHHCAADFDVVAYLM